MQTRLRGEFSLLFLMFGVLLAFPALALADVVKNDITSDVGVGQIRQYAAGDPATSVGYYVDAAGDCDPANGTSATVSLSVSEFNNAALDTAHTGVVTIAPSSLTFTQCDVKQQVNFSTAANAPRGDYTITADATDSGTGDTYNESPATFKLRVIDNCNGQEPGPGTDNSGSPTDGTCDAPNTGGGSTNQPPTADAGGPYNFNEGSDTNPLSGSGTDTDGTIASYAWDLNYNSTTFDVDSTEQNPNFDATSIDGGPDPDGTQQGVALKVTDDDGAESAVDTETVIIKNVNPTITSIVPSSQNILTGKNVIFTGSLTDPAPADTHRWQWSVDGGTLGAFGAFGANTFTTSFSTCGSHYVSGKAEDDDLGLSALYGTSNNASVQVYNGSFLPPVDAAPYVNTVQKGRVIPVKISVSCNGNITGLTPSIQLLSGDKTDGSETTSDEIETYSVSTADSTGVMRAIDGGYIYNLRVPDVANAYYTVRVNPFGGSNASSNMYALLKTRK